MRKVVFAAVLVVALSVMSAIPAFASEAEAPAYIPADSAGESSVHDIDGCGLNL